MKDARDTQIHAVNHFLPAVAQQVARTVSAKSLKNLAWISNVNQARDGGVKVDEKKICNLTQ
jgi:hypothetical protein